MTESTDENMDHSENFGLPDYDEAVLRKRVDRFIMLVNLNAPTILLLSEMRLVNQSMMAAITENLVAENLVAAACQAHGEPHETEPHETA